MVKKRVSPRHTIR